MGLIVATILFAPVALFGALIVGVGAWGLYTGVLEWT